MKSKIHKYQVVKAAKVILVGVLFYCLAGFALGFIGLWLRCQNPLYSCLTISQYITDPWIFSNNLFWPFTLIDGLDKATNY